MSNGAATIRAAIASPAVVMGLPFSSRIGIAAGIDRTGRMIAELFRHGLGAIEIGTVHRPHDLAIDAAGIPAGLRVGVNFGSPRVGIDRDVMDDYAANMAAAWGVADYLVANLSSPRSGRTGDTAGVDVLLVRLKEVQTRLALETGHRRPLLVKVAWSDEDEALPPAIGLAARFALDGIVLVSRRVERLAVVCRDMRDGAAISVGGVATPEDVTARLAAGAALVQVHSAFAAGGHGALLPMIEATAAWQLLNDTRHRGHPQPNRPVSTVSSAADERRRASSAAPFAGGVSSDR